MLARTPDAPEGVKGISLFVVPKFLPDADGAPGDANDVRCVSLEHKLGIHGSPTAVLAFGDGEGAMGCAGRRGESRPGVHVHDDEPRPALVGIEGLAIAERAYQQALAFARERVQGRRGRRAARRQRAAIIHHPDVRRMLMSMKARIEAMRAVAYVCAAPSTRRSAIPIRPSARSSSVWSSC